MTDEEKLKLLDFKNKYKDNPDTFIEDFYPDIKLMEYQKLILKALNSKEKLYYSFFNGRMAQKRWLMNCQLEYMKSMEMDFNVLNKNSIDVYEKGILVRTIKNKTQ